MESLNLNRIRNQSWSYITK